MAGADGALSLGHVAALTNMSIDIRAAGGGAGARREPGIIRVGTCCCPNRHQQRREASLLDAVE
jgi:hypothetical protein